MFNQTKRGTKTEENIAVSANKKKDYYQPKDMGYDLIID